jgi:apolipoprotein N-acyltransferase
VIGPPTSRRQRLAWQIILVALAIPVLVLVLGLLLQTAMGEETHRAGTWAIRFRGTLVLWRYNSQRMELDFFEIARVTFILAVLIGLAMAIYEGVSTLIEARSRMPRGFDVVIPDADRD